MSRTIGRLGHLRRRLTVALTGILLAVAMVGFGPASPANAFTCSWVSASYTHPDGVARVSFRWCANGSDGRSHIEGTLYDTLCDSRMAVVEFDGYTYQTYSPPGWKKILEKDYRASNGCGSSSTFNGTGTNRSYGPSWKLDTVLYARNNNTIPNCCSTKYYRTMSG